MLAMKYDAGSGRLRLRAILPSERLSTSTGGNGPQQGRSILQHAWKIAASRARLRIWAGPGLVPRRLSCLIDSAANFSTITGGRNARVGRSRVSGRSCSWPGSPATTAQPDDRGSAQSTARTGHFGAAAQLRVGHCAASAPATATATATADAATATEAAAARAETRLPWLPRLPRARGLGRVGRCKRSCGW